MCLLLFDLVNENMFTIRGVKTLCPSSFDKTVIHISITIVNQKYERSELIKIAKMIINLVRVMLCYTYFVINYIQTYS